ncbi:endoglucanase family protein [Mycobacteroides abscessus subsp. abscessus]|nr:endoglucanase family protein [Mycobacteroides abscessus subsp. abscessus]
MNGTWYPWSIGVSGNTAEQYRAAWLRMHSIFDDAHADSVRFVWAPNVLTAGTNDFTSAFPGHDHVDYLGLDGYNWGDGSGHRWQWPEELFPDSLSTLARLDSDRPILITEAASADGTTPDAKADWIRRFFGIVEATDRLEGALWFQVDKERDWRFNSTPQSLNAFREAIAKIQGP